MGNDFTQIINEYVEQEVASAISSLVSATSSKDIVKNADVIATVFGACPSIFSKEKTDFEEKLISSFKKNLTLLIQKTWVEKADADLKEQVLYKLAEYCKLIEKAKWKNAYEDFLQITNDVVYLMFGSQTKSEDFVEYALRIDPEFGVFWFYIKNLSKETDWEVEKYRVIMLLGMFFLANY